MMIWGLTVGLERLGSKRLGCQCFECCLHCLPRKPSVFGLIGSCALESVGAVARAAPLILKNVKIQPGTSPVAWMFLLLPPLVVSTGMEMRE